MIGNQIVAFELVSTFKAEDIDRGISVQVRVDYRSENVLDETKNRQFWGFSVQNKGFRFLGGYYSSTFKYDIKTTIGTTRETDFVTTIAIPKGRLLCAYRSRFITEYGIAPSQDEIDRFIEDVEGAFFCIFQPGVESAEKNLGKSIELKIIFFDPENNALAKTPEDWASDDKKALSILLTTKKEKRSQREKRGQSELTWKKRKKGSE